LKSQQEQELKMLLVLVVVLLVGVLAAASTTWGDEIRLHLGGEADIDLEGREWIVVTLGTLPCENKIQRLVNSSVTDLRMFETGSVSTVYTSHTLEHLPHNDLAPENALEALKESRRVLKPGGELFVSVPDLPTLCRFYLSDELDLNLRKQVMVMMYGGQKDEFDYHKAGYDYELLVELIRRSGNWCDIEQIQGSAGFGLFHDASELEFNGTALSLNVRAVACL
jgi:predicted SAM-dependent methyltransferase